MNFFSKCRQGVKLLKKSHLAKILKRSLYFVSLISKLTYSLQIHFSKIIVKLNVVMKYNFLNTIWLFIDYVFKKVNLNEKILNREYDEIRTKLKVIFHERAKFFSNLIEFFSYVNQRPRLQSAIVQKLTFFITRNVKYSKISFVYLKFSL